MENARALSLVEEVFNALPIGSGITADAVLAKLHARPNGYSRGGVKKALKQLVKRGLIAHRAEAARCDPTGVYRSPLVGAGRKPWRSSTNGDSAAANSGPTDVERRDH